MSWKVIDMASNISKKAIKYEKRCELDAMINSQKINKIQPNNIIGKYCISTLKNSERTINLDLSQLKRETEPNY